MVTQAQLSRLAQRIDELAGRIGYERPVVVVCHEWEETEEQALARHGNPKDVILIQMSLVDAVNGRRVEKPDARRMSHGHTHPAR
jgi:hypothetical protein